VYGRAVDRLKHGFRDVFLPDFGNRQWTQVLIGSRISSGLFQDALLVTFSASTPSSLSGVAFGASNYAPLQRPKLKVKQGAPRPKQSGNTGVDVLATPS